MEAALYSTSEPVRLGDRVDCDGTPGRVLQVMGTPEVLAKWGLTEPHVLFESDRDGQYIQSVLEGAWDGNALLGRAESEKLS